MVGVKGVDMNNQPHRVRLEEVEDGDRETEAEDDGSEIVGQIKLNVMKLTTYRDSEVFVDEEFDEQVNIEVFVSTDDEEEGGSD